jgi:hypothetical protein
MAGFSLTNGKPFRSKFDEKPLGADPALTTAHCIDQTISAAAERTQPKTYSQNCPR